MSTFTAELSNRLTKSLAEVIRGRDDIIALLVCALFADGHVLLEDYPGSGKTTLTKALGKLIDCSHAPKHALGVDVAPFRRIQFTPDLLPGDVLGVSIFDAKSSSFRFVAGPVFAHIILADEINRTGPKVQSAFLECMAEKQVTLENTTYQLDPLFFVIGTQNPLDIAGTYPLPIVQLDRFLFKLPMGYVEAAAELDILKNHQGIEEKLATLTPVVTREDILKARAEVNSIHVSEPIQKALVEIVQRTRNNPVLQFGASTRAALMMQKAAKSLAACSGATFVTPDHVKAIITPTLLHRLKLSSGTARQRAEDLLTEITAPVFEALARETV